MSGPSENEFVGQRALVTGGTRGMGEAIVQRLRGAGASWSPRRAASPDLPKADLFVAADISTAGGAETVVRYVLDRLGGVDILVNNLGGSSAPGGGFAALTDEDWQAAFNQRGGAEGRPGRERGARVHTDHRGDGADRPAGAELGD